MLDHLFVDLVSSVQESLDRALLERQPVEDRFQVDVLLGDVSWETSYSLPGEDQPPRVRADISIEWPTWSQTAYRAWTMGESPDEMPEAFVEVAVRVQRLAEAPPADKVLAVLPESSLPIGGEPLVRSATTIEEVRLEPEEAGPAASPAVRWAVEGAYEGTVRFEEKHLEDPGTLVPMVEALTRWVSSTLVQLADLPLTFAPPDPAEDW